MFQSLCAQPHWILCARSQRLTRSLRYIAEVVRQDAQKFSPYLLPATLPRFTGPDFGRGIFHRADLEFFMFDARQSAMDQTLWWDQSFSVNIAELDHQHQRLFRTVAELSYAVRTGRADSIINEVLEKVIQHTISHFAAEELLLQQHGYPGLAAHRYEHQMFAQKLSNFHLPNIAGKPDIPSSLLVFLQTWLRDHILKTDKDYSAFLNARGVF